MPKFVGAVLSASRLLKALGQNGPQRLIDLQKSTGVNGSTALNILFTLHSEGLVDYEPDRRRYALGPQLLELSAISTTEHKASVTKATLDNLSHTLGLAVLLWKRVDRERAELTAAADPGRMNLTFPIGTSMPAYQGAVGRIFASVSNLSRPELGRVYAELSWQTPPGEERWIAEVGRAGRTGHGFDRGNLNTGIFGVAVLIPGPEASHSALAVAGLGIPNAAEVVRIAGKAKQAAAKLALLL